VNQSDLFRLVKSDWRPRAKFPRLVGKAKRISVDVETYDPNLMENGPGALRRDGYVCGFSVGTDDGFCGYYPLRHEGGDNLENPDKAVAWLRDQLTDDTPKVGANLLYDLIWLRCDLGVEVRGPKYDVQVAEPLLDENRWTYTLDSLAETWLGEHKVEELLYTVGDLFLGLKPSKKDFKARDDDHLAQLRKSDVIKQVKQQLWRLPARYVGEYGEADASLPLRIFALQEEELRKRDLWALFDEVETPLIDLLLDMWVRGVPVNVERGEQVRDELQGQYDALKRKMRRRVGYDVDVWSSETIVKACNTLGLSYPLTDKENPSFTANWLAEQEHPFLKMLLEARQLDRGGSVFIEKKILDLEVNGRIHPQFWQVKTDRYGTTSGRFSSSNPNAQQFPARNARLASLIRSVLVAERGCQWGIFDWSQQEPRVTVHYASLLNLPGAEEARRCYVEDPDTDYHQMVADMTNLERKVAKSVNLGLSYGMGPKKYGEKYGKTYQEARATFDTYHKGLPFIRELTRRCEQAVKQRGFIKTFLGRHCHFDRWGPPRWTEGLVPREYEEAKREFGLPLVRYFTYRAMNRLIQGSSADMVKKAMLDCFRAGHVPCLTVHDELDFSDLDSDRKIREVADIMLNCVKLRVPLKLDVELGPSWGECQEVDLGNP